MQFFDTGLPNDSLVYQAFMVCQKNQKMQDSLGDYPLFLDQVMNMFTGGDADTLILMAQILNEFTDGTNPQLLAATLLQNTPVQAHALLQARFGDDILDFTKEALKHQQEKFAHIAEASDRIKLFYLAFYVAGFGALAEACNIGLADESLIEAVPVPGLKAFEHFITSVGDTTSCPALELHCFSIYARAMEFMGMPFFEDDADVDDGANAPPIPDFQETQILQDKLTEAAYDYIVSNEDVTPEQIFLAIRTAQILSIVPDTKKPVTIAAALIQAGSPPRSREDLQTLKEILGKNVAKILSENDPLASFEKDAITRSSPTIQEIALARGIAQLEIIHATTKAILEQQDPSLAGSTENVQQILTQFRTVINEAHSQIQPVLKTTSAQPLQHLYQQEYKKVTATINQNTPSRRRPPPPTGPQA